MMGALTRVWIDASHHLEDTPTYQRGREPVVGEHIERTVDERTIKWTISEISKDPSSIAGTAVFTVRVDETEEGRSEGNESA